MPKLFIIQTNKMHGIYIKMSTLVRTYILFLLNKTILFSGGIFSVSTFLTQAIYNFTNNFFSK
jgi:hypothetical protein